MSHDGARYFLEVTYRGGRVVAAYLYLPRKSGDMSARTTQARPGMLVDWSADGRPIGIEITDPKSDGLLGDLNLVMGELMLPPVGAAEMRPLLAA